MFIIQTQELATQQYITIQNKKTNCLAKICLTSGGSLQQLYWHGTPVINNLQGEGDQTSWLNSSGGAILFPFVNRIAEGKYSYNGTLYDLYCNEKDKKNAIHGLVFDRPFELTSQSADAEMAQVVLRYEHYLSEGFPFPFRIELTYTITSDDLLLEVAINNTGSDTFPFSLGWHPYFCSSDLEESCIQVEVNKRVKVDTKMIPTEVLPFELDGPIWLEQDLELDDAFELTDNKIDFHTPDYSLAIESIGSTPPNYVQIYTPSHHKSVAIEPMTAIADSFNNKIGLRELEAEESFGLIWKLSYDAAASEE